MAGRLNFSFSAPWLQKGKHLEKERLGRKEPRLVQMKDSSNILEVEDLSTHFYTRDGIVKAVDGISFQIPKHSIIGIVGESGCGKSVTALSLLQLLPHPSGHVVEGEIRFPFDESTALDIASAPEKTMEAIRGKGISMIFQEPMSSLNPVYRIGAQIDEVSYLHEPGLTRKEVKAKTLGLLEKVGIPDGDKVYAMYPQSLSGGMRQRVMIAMALASNPRLIIADEPTTSLDTTIQAQILDLLRDLREKTGVSILLITHDLGVAKGMADEVIVMYAGRIVEKGTAEEVFHNPSHPYTKALLASRPRHGGKGELYAIPGNLPDPRNLPETCYFAPRCPECDVACGRYPAFTKISGSHVVACHRRGGSDE